MKMQIEFKKSASKTLKSFERSLQSRIIKGIEGLIEVQPKGDIKPMEGSTAKSYRLRIGGYRIIYTKENSIITIQEIGGRGDIYK